jgi:L-ascorbate metabolism protein UlaG (beta-lactamase superfamily)
MLTGKSLRGFTVPAGSLEVWWLGQAGFLFKSPAGRIIAVDPCLSNSCEALAHLVQPKVVIPYHYNLFPDGSVPAHTLRLNLRLHGMQDRFMTLEPGTPWVYAGGGNG